MRSRTLPHALVSTLVLGACCGVLAAGPLQPSAGPVGPTMKTLAEVEPRTAINATNTPGDASAVYVISQPGTYYLTGPVSVPSGKSGVRIAVAGVSIDMRGFAITGVAGSVDGIRNVGEADRCVVTNGSISGMGGNGVDVSYGLGATIRNVVVSTCGGRGIDTPSAAIVESCFVRECARGICAGFQATVRDCTVRNCTLNGFEAGEATTLENCTSAFNSHIGFWSDFYCVLRGCTAETNQTNGFELTAAALAVNCSSSQNGQDGFNLSGGAKAVGCTASYNTGDGYEAGQRGIVSSCTALSNGTGGVRLSGANAVAEGNTCTGNTGFGIVTTTANTMVVRNTVMLAGSAGTNYSFASGTRYGPISNTAPSGASLNVSAGSSAAGSFTVTDPNTNFNY